MLPIASIVIALLIAKSSSKETHQIIFPDLKTLPYAKLHGTIPYGLQDLTLCYWTRTNSKLGNGHAGIFSYAAINALNNNILTTLDKNYKVWFHRQTLTPNEYVGPVDIGVTHQSQWIHLCFTWSMVDGAWQVFANSAKKGSGNNLSANYSTVANGVVVLGQDQDVVGGGFVYEESLRGQISEVHLWNYVLTPNEISKVYNCTFGNDGNVLSWWKATWILQDGAMISPVKLPCGEPQ